MSLITVKELDQAVNELFGSMYPIPVSGVGQTLYASYHNENEDTYEIFAVGATKDEVKIDVQDGILAVSVEPKLKSMFVKPVNKNFRLSKDADVDSINAKLENGILNVQVKKLKTAKKSITVSVN